MTVERVLITVKTYPTLSKKYGETVCTAGLREDGSWVRIYPVPFRRLNEPQQYSKYDWVECQLERHKSDARPESFRPRDIEAMKSVAFVDTRNKWRARRAQVLGKGTCETRLKTLIADAKRNKRSLAVFRPTEIEDVVHKDDDPNWDEKHLEAMRAFHSQSDLFETSDWRKTFKIIPKMPVKFYYRFRDSDGVESRMRILDWEIGALYWNCRRGGDDHPVATAKVRQKYLTEFRKTDLHFFLGTTQQFHQFAVNPWVIVGVFPVPHETQPSLVF